MDKIGMTSVTFRNLKCGEIIDLCAESGLDGIEWGGDIHVKPGEFGKAKAIKNVCENKGLEIFSYGSYYKAGIGQGKDYFDSVSRTAQALGAMTIRIWPGNKRSAEFGNDEYIALVKEIRDISEIAASREQAVCFEYHKGTYNDCKEASLKILQDINKPNVKTYWQPIDDEYENLLSVNALSGYITNIHVYHWTKAERKLLREGMDSWIKYCKALSSCPHNYILEFTKDDSVPNFKNDAAALKILIADLKK